MKIKSFNKTNASFILNEVEKELQEVLSKYGLELNKSSGSISANHHEFDMKIGIKTQMTPEEALEKARQDFESKCQRYGLSPKVFNKKFIAHDGKTYTIKMIKTRNRKLPIIAEDENGKLFKFTVDTVKNGLKLQHLGAFA